MNWKSIDLPNDNELKMDNQYYYYLNTLVL